MDKSIEGLFTPWKIGNVEIKNRIVLTSMGGTNLLGWMEKNHFDKAGAEFIMNVARNNVGLVLPGCQPVYNPMFGQWLYKNKKMYKDLKEWMPEFHKTGAKLFVQLTAGFGRSFTISELMETLYTNKVLRTLSKPFMDLDKITASASPSPNRWSDKVPSREMTRSEIQEFVEAFAKTALLLKDADVDGVEIHAVHEGYLLDQFTLKYVNRRTDEYGGSLENRYRFATDIVKAIKKVCGDDFPVSLRYSVVSKTKDFRKGALPGEDYVEVGRDMAESEKAVKLLAEAGYDMLNCDNGTYDAWYWAHPPGYMPNNCNLEDVMHIKKFVNIPVVCAGKMTVEAGAKAVKEGKLDGVGFARQFLVDPEWITKLMNDREIDIKPCIHCHNACFNMGHHKGIGNDQPLDDTAHMSRCALNPITMQHKKYSLKKTNNPKNVAIIGAGVGGMETAIVLTKRGHKVTIYEKSNRLGGVFNEAAAPSFKEADKQLLKWYENQLKELNIKVEFNTEVKDINSLHADEVVVATGSKAKRPPIKGIEHSIEACDYLKGDKDVGNKVVIVGGGLTGTEMAYDLILKGKQVVIIEALNDLICTPHVCLANTSFLREMMAYKKVDVRLETKVKEIGTNYVVVTNKDGSEDKIMCDTTIISIGYTPTPIAEPSKHVHIVGDALKVGNLRTVIWRAWDVAMKI